ncbi:ABC transporter permease [Bartonella apis]|uniref:ABC transporter permease n=1 Tax=Bartonella apis TaxID=1686310 RepID=UPI00095FD281|nr:ABC transporter permease [Bartonella apis]OLY49026.1 peptide/nickel transport system permease protein [Bartonella apis]
MVLWVTIRIFQALIIVFLMSVIVFIGLHAIGNPVDILIGQDVVQTERARIIAAMGLDQPLYLQYFDFLKGLFSGNLGNSFTYHVPAVTLILQRLPATFELVVVAMVFAVVIGVLLGTIAGLQPERPWSRLIMAGSIFGFSLPTFWIGLLMIQFFCVNLGWLPASGRGETVEIFGINWSIFTLDGWRHLLLPALTISLFKLAMVIRLTRAGVQEILPLDFVKFARAKGLSPLRVIIFHILRNTLIPLVTVLGLEFGSMIAFSVVTESIFSWPGAGKLILDSINNLDRPVIVTYLMIIVSIFVSINLVVDILYKILDPRVRIEAGR